MFEKDVAHKIRHLIWLFTEQLELKLLPLFNEADALNKEVTVKIITGFTANATLNICLSLSSYFFTYRQLLELEEYYTLTDDKLVKIKPSALLISQVEHDKEEYANYLYDYQFALSPKKKDKEDCFLRISEILISKLGLKFRDNQHRHEVALLLEREYLLLENKAQKNIEKNVKIFWKKLMYEWL